jgi:hypothetical protein
MSEPESDPRLARLWTLDDSTLKGCLKRVEAGRVTAEEMYAILEEHSTRERVLGPAAPSPPTWEER